jgi:hypothetical protein
MQSQDQLDQVQEIPEITKMWQELAMKLWEKILLHWSMKTECLKFNFESIEYQDVPINEGINYENMTDLISEEILDVETLKSKFSNWFDCLSAPSGPIKEESVDDSCWN